MNRNKYLITLVMCLSCLMYCEKEEVIADNQTPVLRKVTIDPEQRFWPTSDIYEFEYEDKRLARVFRQEELYHVLTYNDMEQLVEVQELENTSMSGGVYNLSYDSQNRVQSIEFTRSLDQGKEVCNFVYNDLGQLESIAKSQFSGFGDFAYEITYLGTDSLSVNAPPANTSIWGTYHFDKKKSAYESIPEPYRIGFLLMFNESNNIIYQRKDNGLNTVEEFEYIYQYDDLGYPLEAEVNYLTTSTFGGGISTQSDGQYRIIYSY